MQIEITNEAAARQAASAAGFDDVETYVNQMIVQQADLQAIRDGIADADAGNVRPLARSKAEILSERGIESSTT